MWRCMVCRYLSGVLAPDMTVLRLHQTDPVLLRTTLDAIISQFNLSYDGKPTLWSDLRHWLYDDDTHTSRLAGGSAAPINWVLVPSAAQSSHLPEASGKLALVVDGACLAVALTPALNYKFLAVAQACVSVLCCRCAPLQKAAVVELVQNQSSLYGTAAVTLAIGDGANDVRFSTLMRLSICLVWI
jgi:magnesium-transporting ATPase (P-type)